MSASALEGSYGSRLGLFKLTGLLYCRSLNVSVAILEVDALPDREPFLGFQFFTMSESWLGTKSLAKVFWIV